MLQSIRDRAQSWVAWVIVGLLVVVFAVWGVGSWFTPDSDPVIAEVDGQEIRLREFQNEVRQAREQLRQTLGDRYDDDAIPAALVHEQVLNRMVNRLLLDHMSASAGMRVGDAQLAASIRSQRAFQEDGQFSAERYRQLLQYQGLSEAGYEQRLRRSETIAQVENGVRNSDFAITAEVDSALALLGQKREVYHLDLDSAEFTDQVDVTKAALESFYQDHIETFSVPEQVVVEYLELNLDTLAAQVMVDEASVTEQYEASKATYVTPESRRARHILIEVPADADEATVSAAEQRIDAGRQRLEGGESFADVAQDLSDDPGSAAQGGDLGFFARDAMVPAFDQVAFELEQGVVSAPVRSEFGFHLIEVTEIKAEQVKPMAEVRDSLIRDLQMQQAEQQFYDLGETLANVAYEQPDSLGPAAEAVALEIAQVGPISRQGNDGIAAQAAFLEAAFRPDLVTSGLNSEAIELGPGRVVILRVAEHNPPEPKPLDEVRDEVEKGVRDALAAEQARRLGEALLATLEGGADPVATLAEHGRSWTSDGLIARDDAGLPAEVVARAFSLAPPAADGSRFAGGDSAGDGYTLVRVTRVENGGSDDKNPEERQAIAQALGQNWADAEFSALLASLRATATIVTYMDRIP